MKFSTLFFTAFFMLFIGSLTPVSGQSESATLDIDRQIWEPFKESYRNYDYQVFNALHSDNITRINSKKIMLGEEYKKKNTDWFIKAKKEGYQQSIEFRFDKRVVTGSRAFETGYYKIEVTKPDGKELTYFARFHVSMQQENGQWKITQDWDSGELNGQKVGAIDFYRTKVSDESEASTCTIDFVKVLNNRKEETLFYYDNNWKKLREEAIRKGYIRSFHLLINESSEEDYDIMLLTEYGTPEQYDLKEEHFSELIDARQSGGRKLLNEYQPADFRKIVKDMTVKSR